MLEESNVRSVLKPRILRWLVILIIILIIVGSIFVFWTIKHRRSESPIPLAISEKALYEIYYPSKLPVGYTINQNSFNLSDGILLFGVSDGANHNIAFTEQAKPKDFDFNHFNSGLKDAKNLANTPYTNVLGKTSAGATLLSVTGDTTWLIISSNSSLTEADWRLIAQNLKY